MSCSCNSKRCKHTPMVHLHLHTEFSALDGAAKSSSYVKLAKEYNHPAITILDHGNMSGTLTHYNKCKEAGLQPILGMEAYLNDDIHDRPNIQTSADKEDAESVDNSRSNTHQSIIVKNREGFVNLNKLTYMSFTEGYYYKGRITTEWLFENKNGLIVTSSCAASKFSRLLEEGKEAEAEERIKMFKREFGDDFYAELQFNEYINKQSGYGQKKYNHFILKMIKKYDLQPILTGDVHYALPEDNKLQDILIAINQRKPVGDFENDKRYAFHLTTRQLNYANVADFHRLNKEMGFNYPEDFVDKCLENTLKVAAKCNFEFETGVDKYPKYEATPDVVDYFKSSDTKEIITKLAHAKLKQKLSIYRKNNIVKVTPEVEQQYKDRLDYELQVIDDKKMLDYFLVVWELIRFCQKESIGVGPGRGSSAGCLLAWCLDITKIDSIRFGLYFERFLNPTRKGAPDIDIDFEAGTDDKTLQFLYDKYGKERVVPVVTFGTFNEKNCIKDVSKALGNDAGFSSEIFQVTKEMPQTPTWQAPYDTLEKWIELYPENPECSDIVRNWIRNPANKEIIDYTIKLQGQVRNLGKHAAGIVITPGPVWELMPVNICKGQVVSGYQESGTAKDISSIGGLKLDRLKLETLNVMKDALKYIKERHGEEEYLKAQEELDYIDIEDQNLFIELRMGNNQGIFQFESDGMNSLIKGMQVEKFEELVAANALYRPGPMNMKPIGAHEQFIINKFNPNKRKYAHKSLKPLLEETNGVLVFQEQLMFIAHEIGKMSLGEGDNLRKVMDNSGKLIAKKLQNIPLTEDEENNKHYKDYVKLWHKFIDGAKSNGLSEDDVQAIESWLVEYLGYSFNKSHSVSYSYVAMQTLYLKHYYPTEFYCALLNHPKTSTDKEKDKRWLASALMAAMSKGIEIVPPNRRSNWEWTIIDDRKIAMGYMSINGLGEIAYEELKAGSIDTMNKEDFFQTKWRKFNKKGFEMALKAGLFDDWSNSREELLSIRNTKIKDITQYDLFTNEAGVASLFKSKKHLPTSEDQKYQEFIDVCNLDLKLLKKINKLKATFQEETGENIEPVTNFDDPTKFYYFSIQKVEEKISAGKGVKYYSLLISDGATVKRVNMWKNMYDKVKKVITEGSFYITKFVKEKGFLSFNASADFRKVG